MATWARELAGFADRPEAIKRALESQKESPFPPTLPEFLALCRQAARSTTGEYLSLPQPPIASPERAERFASEVVKQVAPPADKDVLDWARRPISLRAIDLLRSGASRDIRLRRILADLTAAGVIDAQGAVTKLWDGQAGQWVPVRS